MQIEGHLHGEPVLAILLPYFGLLSQSLQKTPGLMEAL
jgi:hypothetical protein